MNLEFLAAQSGRVLDEQRFLREEQGALRYDMAVLLAMMQRLDGEVRAMHTATPGWSGG